MRPDSSVVNVTQLRRRAGSRQEVHRSIPVSDLALTSASVPDGNEVVLDLVLESISDGIVATGTIGVDWVGSCRRCLRDVQGSLAVEIREVFETRAVEGDTWPLEGDHVDLEPMVRDSTLLGLPLAPLCDDTCRGPAPERFPAVTIESQDPGGDPGDQSLRDGPRDPRWAALDELDFGG